MSKIPVRNPDMIRNEIIRLHDIHGLSYREISELIPFWTIPAGTLCAIANGYPIPNKHRTTLGLPPLVKVPADMVRKTKPRTNRKPRNRRAINLNDASSAAATIVRHGDSEFVRKLLDELTFRTVLKIKSSDEI